MQSRQSNFQTQQVFFQKNRLLKTNLADVDLKDRNGNTALALAARNGHIDIVEFLIGYGNMGCQGFNKGIQN